MKYNIYTEQGTNDGIHFTKIAACCKHFFAYRFCPPKPYLWYSCVLSCYSLEDSDGANRHNFDAEVSKRDLAETYLPPFGSCLAANPEQVHAQILMYPCLLVVSFRWCARTIVSMVSRHVWMGQDWTATCARCVYDSPEIIFAQTQTICLRSVVGKDWSCQTAMLWQMLTKHISMLLMPPWHRGLEFVQVVIRTVDLPTKQKTWRLVHPLCRVCAAKTIHTFSGSNGRRVRYWGRIRHCPHKVPFFFCIIVQINSQNIYVYANLIMDETLFPLCRAMRMRFNLGMFDPIDSVSYKTIGASVLDSKKGQELALRAAEEAIILLQNAASNDDAHLPLVRFSVKCAHGHFSIYTSRNTANMHHQT